MSVNGLRCTPLRTDPRISEGYRFELRCEPPDDGHQTLIDALRMCRKPDSLKGQTAGMTETISLIDHHQAIVQNLRAGTEALTAPPTATEFRKIQVDPADPDKGVDFDQGVKLVNRVLAAQAQEASIPAAATLARSAP